jgi:saccharopine dehydrogenase (NAD+, L-lysine-forming)
MAVFLILGGYGYTGRLLARHLITQSGADIILAGRSLEKATTYASQLNAEFGTAHVTAARVDAASKDDLQAALQGVDMLVVAAPTTRHARTVIQAALECRVDYLDVQLDTGKLKILESLAPQIEQAGLCFITEAGFHPGLPAAMVHAAASRLNRLDSAVTAAYLNMGQSMPYTEAVDELMEMFRDYQAQVFKDRTWTKPSSYEMRKVDFGGEIGLRRCFSMFLEEIRPLPEMYPGLQEVGFYMSETHWLVDWVIFPLCAAGIKLFPKRGLRPLGRLIWWGMQNLPRPPYLVKLKVEAFGQKDGQPARVEMSISHRDGYELTAIPDAACLLQVLDGSARKPGLWMMGHLVDPSRLLVDMQNMGVQVEWHTPAIV